MSEARIDRKIRRGARALGRAFNGAPPAVVADVGAMQFECDKARVLGAERAAPRSRKCSGGSGESYGNAMLTLPDGRARLEEEIRLCAQMCVKPRRSKVPSFLPCLFAF